MFLFVAIGIAGSSEKINEILIKNDVLDSTFCDACLYFSQGHDSQCYSIPQNNEVVLNVLESISGRLNVRCHMKMGLDADVNVLRNGYILIAGVDTSVYRLSEHVKNEVHFGIKENLVNEDEVLNFLHPKL
jgi:hypothetical protein